MVAIKVPTGGVTVPWSAAKRLKKKLVALMSKRIKTTEQMQAVSDGELNMSRPSGTGSNLSLSNTSTRRDASSGADNPASKVVSWAVCFERLLEDPLGVRYFTAFLKSEVSAENILFWKACEKFQEIPANRLNELKKEARAIFETYLSENSFHAVNIDDTARVNESDLENPTPDMFSKAQQQIFKLMKFDSYARFVRSPLYQSCMLATVEGRLLPELDSHNKCVTPTPDRKSAESRTPSSDSKATKSKKLEKRGSWGDVTYGRVAASRQDSQISVKSNSSLDLGSFSHKSENGNLSPDVESRVDKYCCVFLPDGTASLAPARPGLPLRDMLSGLCEKRGFPMKDVIIYFHGKDKNTCPRQQPLTLDQDSSFLMDQQVSLELRITFKLEVVFAQKSMGIVAKSSKTLGDSLSSVLEKHQLRTQDVVVTVSGSKEPLNLNTTVYPFANKTLCLDRAKNLGSVETKGAPTADRTQMSAKPRKRNEMDGLVEMLTRVQCSRADDQRGLLTKEQLELPQFLLLQTDDDDEAKPENAQENNLHSPPAKAGPTTGQTCFNGGHKDSNEKNQNT